jgi:hypothetical protein
LITSSLLSFESGQVYLTGGRGPVGPVGPAGASVISKTAGENITVNRLVYVDGGLVYHADKDDLNKTNVFGLATQSVSSGGAVEILTFGERSDAFSYPDNGDIWLGNNGQILTTAPTTGTLVHVGAITSSSSIILNISDGIVLA